jgi:hypothetical protein
MFARKRSQSNLNVSGTGKTSAQIAVQTPLLAKGLHHYGGFFLEPFCMRDVLPAQQIPWITRNLTPAASTRSMRPVFYYQ